MQIQEVSGNQQVPCNIPMLWATAGAAACVELNGTKNGELSRVTSPKEINDIGLLKLSGGSSQIIPKDLGIVSLQSTCFALTTNPVQASLNSSVKGGECIVNWAICILVREELKCAK
jgi:hypothetical protein